MHTADALNAISGVMALRAQMCMELDAIERQMKEVDPDACAEAHVDANHLLDVYRQARAELVSGLASVDEVLRWLRMSISAGEKMEPHNDPRAPMPHISRQTTPRF